MEVECEARVLNVNVGILGHIDSGKTSLAKALSTLLSTAALDKHPQSAERGITLDLGFSAFQVDVDESFPDKSVSKVQFTLVDCPGHASLIRTIIGGAQIIDLMLLVVDVTKGFQTQTAECLVVGEVTETKRLVVVLNKCDLLLPSSKSSQIQKMSRRVLATMKGTKFENPDIVATSVCAGREAEGVNVLVQKLMECAKYVRRGENSGPFLFAVDHCFPIKGQGTVLTGTVLQGHVSVNDTIEIPALKMQKKVKSMQMFHRPVSCASKGDRVGICVAQLDAKLMERGLVAAPAALPTVSLVVALVYRIRFHKSSIPSKGKYHITVGHSTVMAEALFFCTPTKVLEHLPEANEKSFDFDKDYLYCNELLDPTPHASEAADVAGDAADIRQSTAPVWCLLRFETPVVCPPNALLIASRLDFDVHSPSCRLAFHGRVTAIVEPGAGQQSLRVYKMKTREGVIERVADSYSVIGKGFFKKETDISQFIRLNVQGPEGLVGVLQSSFGKSGKFKVVFQGELPKELTDKKLVLQFKRYVFDKERKLLQ